MRLETELLPWLADRLPLRIPEPFVANDEPLVVRHERVVGEPLTQLDEAAGRALANFLRQLHGTNLNAATGHGLPSAEASLSSRADTIRRFHDTVVPLLPEELRSQANALLEELESAPADTVVHSDLGPEHILCTRNTISGVIDFGAVQTGDPAIDLSWALCNTPPEFAAAVAEHYDPPIEVRQRARLWHQLGPWYEVVHGQDQCLPGYIASGLRGVLNRLR